MALLLVQDEGARVVAAGVEVVHLLASGLGWRGTGRFRRRRRFSGIRSGHARAKAEPGRPAIGAASKSSSGFGRSFTWALDWSPSRSAVSLSTPSGRTTISLGWTLALLEHLGLVEGDTDPGHPLPPLTLPATRTISLVTCA